ncbi:type IV toxin-antitoxin system AbiEi family antitoxin domain-containing protein [Streptomyces sp. M10(2022)]
MDRSETIRTLAGIATDQWGLVTTAQAEAAGVSRVNLARLGTLICCSLSVAVCTRWQVRCLRSIWRSRWPGYG